VDPGNNILSATLALVAIMLASTQLMGSRRSDDVRAFQALFPDPRSSIPLCSFVSFVVNVVKAFAFFPITRSRDSPDLFPIPPLPLRVSKFCLFLCVPSCLLWLKLLLFSITAITRDVGDYAVL
jgi:hypothetical protein